MCFLKDREHPCSPLLVPCTGLSHCSIVCRICPFAVCQTPLQNLPSPLPQTIIFPFLAPFWTLLFFPAFKRRLVFPSLNLLILNSVSHCYDFPSACGPPPETQPTWPSTPSAGCPAPRPPCLDCSHLLLGGCSIF